MEGKEAQAEFGHMTDDIRRYNRLEVELLERLMNKFRSTCQAIGHLPAKWQGPGDLVSAFLQYHRVPKKHTLPLWEDPEYREFWKFADRSYYGGRFEASAVGRDTRAGLQRRHQLCVPLFINPRAVPHPRAMGAHRNG